MKHLSRFDIEAIADKYVQAYMALPDVRNTQIYRIDPELLLEKVLGLNVEYQHLSYDGSISRYLCLLSPIDTSRSMSL